VWKEVKVFQLKIRVQHPVARKELLQKEQARQDFAKVATKDVSKIDQQKLSRHEAIRTQILGYEAKLESSVRLSLSLTNDTAKNPRTMWSEDDVKRLIHARTEHNTSSRSTTTIWLKSGILLPLHLTRALRRLFNDSVTSAGGPCIFDPLPEELHRVKDTIKHKFEDVVAEFRNILRSPAPTLERLGAGGAEELRQPTPRLGRVPAATAV
jgi:hypothetical protein